MYQVTIKGRNLDELKKAVADINNELGNDRVVNGMENDIEEKHETVTISKIETPTLDLPNNTSIITPIVPVAPVIAPNTDNELDSNNIPWDKRIHTSAKTTIKTGAWKYRRGLDDNTKLEVEAEIKANIQRLTNPAPIPAAPITPETPIVAPAPIVEAAPLQVVPPVVAPVAPVPTLLPTNGGHTIETFSENLPMIIATLISEGKINQDYVNTLADYFKVHALWRVSDDQKIEMFETFVNSGLITKVA